MADRPAATPAANAARGNQKPPAAGGPQLRRIRDKLLGIPSGRKHFPSWQGIWLPINMSILLMVSIAFARLSGSGSCIGIYNSCSDGIRRSCFDFSVGAAFPRIPRQIWCRTHFCGLPRSIRQRAVPSAIRAPISSAFPAISRSTISARSPPRTGMCNQACPPTR